MIDCSLMMIDATPCILYVSCSILDLAHCIFHAICSSTIISSRPWAVGWRSCGTPRSAPVSAPRLDPTCRGDPGGATASRPCRAPTTRMAGASALLPCLWPPSTLRRSAFSLASRAYGAAVPMALASWLALALGRPSFAISTTIVNH